MRALIMAGGEGQRLRPLTLNCPKPLLPLDRDGDERILDGLVDGLLDAGFEVTVSVNYLAQMIVDRYGDRCSYIHDPDAGGLGTAGALGMMGVKSARRSESGVLVVNGDIITDLDWFEFYRSGEAGSASIQMAMYDTAVRVKYGVVDIDHTSTVVSITEKPKFRYLINAGIYYVSPWVIRNMRERERVPIDMTDLIMSYGTTGYMIKGTWKDIGTHYDYKRLLDGHRIPASGGQ